MQNHIFMAWETRLILYTTQGEIVSANYVITSQGSQAYVLLIYSVKTE